MKYFKLNEKIRNKKAITLISLVVTIVVLVILAAVAINIAIGNNGLFNKTKLAKQDYANASEKEKEDINILTNDIDSISGSRSPSSQSQPLSAQNIYSTTEETIIGTWIDGKPVYRKVYEFTNTTLISYSANTWYNTGFTSPNVDYYINAVVSSKSNEATYSCIISLDSNIIYILGSRTTNFITPGAKLIIEYTKNN